MRLPHGRSEWNDPDRLCHGRHKRRHGSIRHGGVQLQAERSDRQRSWRSRLSSHNRGSHLHRLSLLGRRHPGAHQCRYRQHRYWDRRCQLWLCPANLTYTLRNTAGATLATGHGTLAAGAHLATFIDLLNTVAPDFVLPANFQTAIQFASMDISSDQPISVLALRMTTNQRNEALFTTTPTADLTKATTNSVIFFPQFADGGGYTTSLVLLNTSNATETGTLQLLNDNGNPLVVNQVGGTSGSIFRYSIPSGGAFRFQTDGSPATTASRMGSGDTRCRNLNPHRSRSIRLQSWAYPGNGVRHPG